MTSIFIFISGATLLVYSAERLVGSLVGVSRGLAISVFLLAIIFTGIEFDDIVLGLAVIAICGIIIGAATVSTGTDQILNRYSIEATVFGATVVTAVLSIEDLFLTVRPIRRGVPEIGIGNVIGSLIFSVTGKLGIVVLAGGSVAIGSSVLRWHLPVLVCLTGLSAYFMWNGRLKRWHGFVLLGLYIAYWVVSFAVYGGAPVDD